MTDSNGGGGSFPNRAHYLKASLAGGAVAALLSVTPILNMLNVFFGLLIMAGGAFAVWMVQKKTQRVEVLEATVLGLLSGLVCGVILFGLASLVGVPLFGIAIADAPSYRQSKIMVMAMMAFGGACCTGVTIYPLIGAIGGAVGGLIFKPDPAAAAAGPDGQPVPKAPPTPEELAKRSRIKKVVAVTCLGCLGLTMLGCLGSGYLVYLEERDVEDTVGQDAVLEVPLEPGTTQRLTLPPSDGSTGRYGFWLVSDSALPSTIDVDGEMGCARTRILRDGAPPRLRNLYTYGPHEDDDEWLFLDSHYTFSFDRETVCGWEITTNPPVPGARIVVTQLKRPSDWFD